MNFAEPFNVGNLQDLAFNIPNLGFEFRYLGTSCRISLISAVESVSMKPLGLADIQE